MPSLNNSRFRIFSLSRENIFLQVVLFVFKTQVFFNCVFFDEAGKMNTSFSVRTVLFSRTFAKICLASCSVGSVRSSVRGFFLMLLNLPIRFSSVICVVTTVRFKTSFTSFVVGTKFWALDLSGSSGTPCIRMLFLILSSK